MTRKVHNENADLKIMTADMPYFIIKCAMAYRAGGVQGCRA